MLIDTHCHLTDRKFEKVKEIVEEARAVGVEKIILPGTSIEDSKRVLAIAQQENLLALVGVHPEDVESIGSVDQMIYELEEMIGFSDKVVGIGEIGLDFFWDKEKKTKDKQVEIFMAQMELATKLKLPVVVHMREAEEEMMEVLEQLGTLPRGQFHCFAGSESFMNLILEKGFYVSFAGNITYKTAGRLRELLRGIPEDKLLLETDSPYLTPEPLRGSLNKPANVKIVAEFVAHELDLDTEKIIEQTGKNAICLYSLDT